MSVVTGGGIDVRTVESPVVATSRPQKLQAWIETSLILVGLVALLVLLPHGVFSDGKLRYEELVQLFTLHHIPAEKFSLYGPIFVAPIWFVGSLLHISHNGVAVYNWCVFVVGLAVAYLALRKHVNTGLIRKFFLVLIAASMFPNHLTNFYGEIFTATCVGVGSILAVYGPAFVGWVAIALGVANTPATLVGLVGLVVVRVWEMRRLRYVLAIAAAGGLIVLENWVRRGNPLDGGYGGEPGWTTPFLVGLLSILFSFGKGILFYAPGLMLPVRKRLAALRDGTRPGLFSIYLLWMVFLGGIVIVYSKWWAWYGGWWWGPRFFLIASLPASLALAVWLHMRNRSLVENLLTLFMLVWSVWVGINGAVFDQRALASICMPGLPHTQEFRCFYLPQDSALWRPLFVQVPLTSSNILFIVYAVLVFAWLAMPVVREIARQLRALRPRARALSLWEMRHSTSGAS